MSDRPAISREIDALERLHRELSAIAARNDERRRHDLVDLRRKLAAQIAEVGRVAEEYVTRGGDDDLLRDYRNKFSQMRSAAASHQARWPAVMLGENDEEYRDSARAVREANVEFVNWLRRALASN